MTAKGGSRHVAHTLSDSSNIFVCEYCNGDGEWQYLILVRDGKGSAWSVLHDGSSYKE